MNPPEIHVIGCGGVACNLIINLLQTAQFALGKPDIHLWDGDKFEDKNISRQFAANGAIGKNKADAFVERFADLYSGKIISHPDFFHEYSHEFRKGSLIICMVDNHAARRAARFATDQFGLILVSGANETEEGEAWSYLPEWKDTALDPWIRYPDLHNNVGSDPVTGTGCNSDVAFADNPQIPAGNFMTAACILWIVNGLFREDSEPNYEHAIHEARFMKNGLSSTTAFRMLKKQETT